GPFDDIHGGLSRYQAGIKASADRSLIHAGADEHDFLSAVTVDAIPILSQFLTPERIVRPAFDREARPPETRGVGGEIRTRLADCADPLRPCCQPEMPLGANDARPGLLDELIELDGIEGTARAVDEIFHAVLFGLRHMFGKAV